MLAALQLMLGNIPRHPLRTTLMALGTMVLVLVVTLVLTVLSVLDEATRDKAANFKAIVTERWQVPSQMPYSYANKLSEGGAVEPDDPRPIDYMTWGFFAGTTEKDMSKADFSKFVFAFVMEPEKISTMLDDLDLLTGPPKAELDAAVERLKENRRGIIVGQDRLKSMGKQIGDRVLLYGRNFKEIDLEVEIVGVFPPSRYNSSAVIRRDYFNAAIDQYPVTHKGQAHPMADKTLNLAWLKVPSNDVFAKMSENIVNSPTFTAPTVKCETASSGTANFLEAYRDLIWGTRWLLAPACMATLALVIANAISISVRERRMEFAILKVLGYGPGQILVMVLGEAVLIGAVAGFLSSVLCYAIVNFYFSGLPFRIAFFPNFFVPAAAMWWGAAMGAGTALVGSFLPAWNARSVKVSDVFSRVA